MDEILGLDDPVSPALLISRLIFVLLACTLLEAVLYLHTFIRSTMSTANNLERDRKALLVGISYKSNLNLENNGFRAHFSAHRDVEKLKELLMSTFYPSRPLQCS